MIPKKFLFHTMSAITLSFALTTAGYAADAIPETQNLVSDSLNTQQIVSSAVYAPTETAAPVKTNINLTNAVNINNSGTDNPVEAMPTDTETNVTEVLETPKQDSLAENNIPKEITDAADTSTAESSAAPTQGHAPVIITTEVTEQTLPVSPSPSTGHAPIEETNISPAVEKSVPITQDNTAKITIVDPVSVSSPKETPVKGVSAANYTVKKGDTLFIIARNYGTSVSAIKSTNGLKSDALYVGQKLAIPTNTAASSTATYKVKKGDTLYLISKKYGTTVSAIKSTNGLKSSALYVGQVLKIPGKSTPSNTSSGYTSVTVKKGDTLYLLSKRYGTTVSAIKSINGLKSDTLMVGKVLKIPSSTIPASSASRQNTLTASRSEASRSEVLLLARLIYGESRGEPYEGQVAVGAVVLNRVSSALFPNTIAGVIYQTNEFSVVLDGQINMTPDATAIKAAEAALSGYDPSGGALFYWNPLKAPNNKFLNAKPIIARIGSHVFAK